MLKLDGTLSNAHRRLTVACAYNYATIHQMETYGEQHYRRVLRDLNDPMWNKPASEIALELALDEILSKEI